MLLKEKITKYWKSQSDGTTLTVVSLFTFFLIILIGIIVFGFYVKVTITGKVVSIEAREATPPSFDLVVLLVAIIIIIFVVLRINREEY